MAKKSPKFSDPRQYRGKPISKQQLDKERLSPLPDWVKCKVCGGRPVGANWLKPVSTDPDCKIFIHLNCISQDLTRTFSNQVLH